MSSKSDDDKAEGSESSSLPVTESSESKETATKNVESETEKVNTSRASLGDEEVADTRVTRQTIRKQEIDEQRDKFLSMSTESKRKLYRSKYTTLKDVQTWPEHYNYILRVNSKAVKQAENCAEQVVEIKEDFNKKVSIFQGDITTLEIDAIANAAHESLLGGGGVDGAIHRAAGPDLLAECETLDGCTPGNAKITCGYKLPAKYVIHTVGPRGERPKVLRSCYLQCLELVKKHKLKTIAFPCISTGIFGYPNSRAAKVVLKTLREWLEKDEYAANVERIILCLFLKVDVDVYLKLLPIYFPISSKVDETVNQSSAVKSEEHEESSSPPEMKSDDKKETEERKEEDSGTQKD